MINKLGRPLRRIRQLALTIEAQAWARWHRTAAPPEHEGATEHWSPAAAFAATEPADWDEDAAFWAEWNTNMAVIERYVSEQLHTIEVLARAFLTGGHTDDNLPIVVALAAS